jgi:hypothetical protein
MTKKLKDEIIKDFEKRVNEKINTLYNTFYIQPYYSSIPTGYGVIFNGQQIALCKDLNSLEQNINTILFFLNGGLTR